MAQRKGRFTTMGKFAIEGYPRGEQGKTPFNGPGKFNGKAGFKFTSFRIDFPLAARIDQIAQGEGQTFTTVVHRLLERGVKEFGPIKKGVEPRFGPSAHARDDYSEKTEKAPKKKKKAKEAEEEAPKKKKKAKAAEEEAPKKKKKAKEAAEEEAPKKKKVKKKKVKVAEPEETEEDEPEIVDE